MNDNEKEQEYETIKKALQIVDGRDDKGNINFYTTIQYLEELRKILYNEIFIEEKGETNE